MVLHWAPLWSSRRLRLSTRELGLVGERVAARALRAAGWRLLGRRVRTCDGELDLVVGARGALLAIEVKTGRMPATDAEALVWRPMDRWSRSVRRRQARAAARLARSLGGWTSVHLAACEVRLSAGNEAPRLLWFWEGAGGAGGVPGPERNGAPTPPDRRGGR